MKKEDKKVVSITGDTVLEQELDTNLEEALGIWAMYSVTGRVPADASMEDLDAIGNLRPRLKDVTNLFNGLLHKERQLIESLIDDNAVKDIILQDNLGVTEEDYAKARETRDTELEQFQQEMQAQIALAQAELAIKKDKELKGE